MRYIKSLILILILLTVSGCASTTVEDAHETSSTAITCVHKYESSWRFTYEPENITRFISNNVVQFYIRDVHGQDVFLNIYEIENYNCR